MDLNTAPKRVAPSLPARNRSFCPIKRPPDPLDRDAPTDRVVLVVLAFVALVGLFASVRAG